MSPILVPTLAELGIELDLALVAYAAANAAVEGIVGLPKDHPLELAFETACGTVSLVASQVVELDAQRPTDWQVKAKALLWFTDEATASPSERLARQVAQAMLSGEVWR